MVDQSFIYILVWKIKLSDTEGFAVIVKQPQSVLRTTPLGYVLSLFTHQSSSWYDGHHTQSHTGSEAAGCDDRMTSTVTSPSHVSQRQRQLHLNNSATWTRSLSLSLYSSHQPQPPETDACMSSSFLLNLKRATGERNGSRAWRRRLAGGGVQEERAGQ